uniref:uncharacterized protein LOC100186758 isoform X2 n=1 Tax=Ciona intestinalis TaxID=7719 RepID=UPI000EF47D12|nr:uncharacterized protein LOC100186758 isoform X2 [Ciona intestinalis]|eukprot:XP_026694880.1 uncharacterized protein LOC100186758 isoform X2 [Ciona intestinalis]
MLVKTVCCLLVCGLNILNVESRNDVNVHYYSNKLTEPEFITSHLQAEYTSKTGRKVYVFDNVIPYSLLSATRQYFSMDDHWRFVQFDEHIKDPNAKYDNGNGVPWKSWQDPTLMSATRIGHILKAMVDTVSANVTSMKPPLTIDQGFKMTEIYSGIVRRGDQTLVHSDTPAPNCTSVVNGYSTVTYTNTLWRKNSYGEMLFYEDNLEELDIFAAVSARFGRVIVWDSAIQYITRPPGIAELAGQYLIFSRFEMGQSVVYDRRTKFHNLLEDMKTFYTEPFVCSDNVESVPTLDLDKHLTLHRTSKAGEFVNVFDGLFSQADLDALRTYSIKYGKYYYDDHLDMSSDNVQWIAGFNVNKFANSRFWPVISQVATYVSGNNTWYPYDVACNLIRSADHTRFHLDTSHTDEKEMTFLLYLSPNWTAADYGETAFMEHNYDSPDNDYVAEVVPMYGRAVIFTGNFPHSARPPAPYHAGPRYTFAVKMSFTKWEAVSKTFSEESRHSMLSIKETIAQIVTDPEMYAANQKVSTVASYLQTKAVQQSLDHNSGMLDRGGDNEEEARSRQELKGQTQQQEQGEEEEGEEEDGEEGEGGYMSEEDMMLLNDLVSQESEIQMSPENQKRVLEMAKFHGLDKQKHMEVHEDEEEGKSSEENQSMQQQEKKIAMWKYLCKKDANCLSDYLELFLKQQIKLKGAATRDMYAII